MNGYQVAIFGRDGVEAERFRRRLEVRLSDLQIDLGLLRFLYEAEVGLRDKGRLPTLGVYFGLDAHPVDPQPNLTAFLADGHVVVPVVVDLEFFSAFVPDCLRSVNGHAPKHDDRDFDELCAVVLENLGLLRRSRRIFISYKRTESRGVAIQLYEELDRRTFDVFLDTLAIRPGEPFQEVLWHRLADTDVMVLLDSPGFLQSRWTEAELARANSTSLQILQVVWPEHNQSADAAFSQSFDLVASDFQNPKVRLGETAMLSANVIDEIALQAERLRARAMAARQAHLVREMFREAQALGLDIVAQPGRYLELRFADGENVIIVPTVGVPDALRYQEIEEDIATDPDAVVLLAFDERGIRDRWLKHLQWLDPAMRVKSLPIGEVQAWMSNRCAS